jgi:hypothetical protein
MRGQSSSDKAASNSSLPNKPPSKTSGNAAADESRPATVVPGPFLRNIVYDQKTIWTSPFKAKVEDLNWIVPMVGLTAGMINADAELSSRIDTTGSFSKHAGTISNAGLAAAVAGGGGLYLIGKYRSDDHQQEAGIVAGEAAINSLIVAEVLKMVSRRERPTDGTGQGRFFKNGSILNSSFPSVHAMATWSIASAVAHEYPGPLTQTFAYGLATGVSLARVYGKDHFPSDVIAGATMGWLIGRQVYASHHRADLPGGGYGTFHQAKTDEPVSAQTEFSPYVPLDSWVYPAFDRLAGLGVINSNFAGLKPWTRAECARLLEEAEGSIDVDSGDEGSRLVAKLTDEFASELNGDYQPNIRLDSVYARVTGISGTPLTDSYHFGQTIVNDFGRPFQNGGNGLGGFSASGSSGNLGFYIRGEYEHAPSAPGFSQTVQDAIQIADFKPPAPAQAIPEFNQFRLLDTYVTLNIKGWATSFGKQSLWLGPNRDPLLQSDNAVPMYMLRVDTTLPRQLPSIFRYLGPYRIEFWVGKMTGHHFVQTQSAEGTAVRIGRSLDHQPMVNGTKINFKPTPNFEFGVGRSGVFGGPDFPLTGGSIRHVLFSTTNAQGRGLDPGDRRSSFDFNYRLPGMRNWLTLYEDSMVEDEISPIGYPRRSAHAPGLYLSHVPGLPHMDMRVEAAYTDLPGLIQPPQGGGFFYWNVRYLDGYTNKGNIIGDATVGRQGIALRADTTYWVASDKTVQFGYRSNIASEDFLQGGNLRDFFLHSEWSFSHHFSLTSFLQYENWNFPLLSAGKKQNDFTASFQLTYWPHWRLKGGR